MKQQFGVFLLRWAATSFGMWLAVKLLGGIEAGTSPDVLTYIGAGLAFSVVNTLLKSIITILSLPFIIVTLGLFMLVVNGLMVYIALLLVPSLNFTFFQAILAGIVLSMVNYALSTILDLHSNKS